jgi:riboflavin synthase alpha subunit
VFTGLVKEAARVKSVEAIADSHAKHIEIETSSPEFAQASLGASIALN